MGRLIRIHSNRSGEEGPGLQSLHRYVYMERYCLLYLNDTYRVHDKLLYRNGIIPDLRYLIILTDSFSDIRFMHNDMAAWIQEYMVNMLVRRYQFP